MLVRRHAPVAMRTAALLGAGSDAEDVVQEALVKAHQSLDRFDLDRPFRPWLLRIVAHEAHNAHRSAVRRSARERRTLTPDLLDPATEVEGRAAKEQLLEAVGRLPDRLRVVVTCRYLLQLDEAETATVLGLPRGTVKSRLSRGLGRLRTELAPVSQGRENDHV